MHCGQPSLVLPSQASNTHRKPTSIALQPPLTAGKLSLPWGDTCCAGLQAAHLLSRNASLPLCCIPCLPLSSLCYCWFQKATKPQAKQPQCRPLLNSHCSSLKSSWLLVFVYFPLSHLLGPTSSPPPQSYVGPRLDPAQELGMGPAMTHYS